MTGKPTTRANKRTVRSFIRLLSSLESWTVEPRRTVSRRPLGRTCVGMTPRSADRTGGLSRLFAAVQESTVKHLPGGNGLYIRSQSARVGPLFCPQGPFPTTTTK